jgi:hypothetical protein
MTGPGTIRACGRTDRILDEAARPAGPVNLTQLSGLSAATAIRYVKIAHPYRFNYRPGAGTNRGQPVGSQSRHCTAGNPPGEFSPAAGDEAAVTAGWCQRSVG